CEAGEDPLGGGPSLVPHCIRFRTLTQQASTPYFVGMDGASQIRDWPTDERPRERLYHKGAAALSDAELLAIQIGTGIRGLGALDVAHALLAEVGGLGGLAGGGVGGVR